MIFDILLCVVDVDECQSSQFSCPPNTDCINSDGSYECRCKQGFVKKGSRCVGKFFFINSNKSPKFHKKSRFQ